MFIVLLGPQRTDPTVAEVARELGVRGPAATITAGWEERESDDQELDEHLGGRTRNLKLWTRTEAIFEKDPELLAGLRTRKERIARLQTLYSIRLNHAMAAARELLNRQEPDEILEPEVEDALRSVRRIDRHHLERVREIDLEFNDRYRPNERDELARHKRDVARIVEDCDFLCIAGGHVAVLLLRLNLFEVTQLTGLRPILAWSAGAMALGEQVVLFHDSPPQGFGHAQVYAPGLGAYRQALLLPHARHRLKLGDPVRVSLLARRFRHLRLLPFDGGDRVDWRGHYLDVRPGTRVLTESGAVLTEGTR